MQCIKPYWLRSEKIEVPCGHCIADRIAYSREWSCRLMHELDEWPEAGFVTLTYDDEHLPRNMSIHKAELSGFLKRLRKNTGRKFKFFGCGEYGDPKKTFRPHYHLILFGLGRASCVYDCDSGRYLSPDIAEAWRNGFHEVDTVTYDSCRYVTDYIMKKYDGDKAADYYGDRTVPFCLCSNGLGRSYVERNWKQLLQNQGMTMRGVHMAVPRYYVKKIKEWYESEKERRAEHSEAPSDYDGIIELFDSYQSNIVAKARQVQQAVFEYSQNTNFAKNLARGVFGDDLRNAAVYAALRDDKDDELAHLFASRVAVVCEQEIARRWQIAQGKARNARLVGMTSIKSKPL